jgi:chromosomal replication initiator protein
MNVEEILAEAETDCRDNEMTAKRIVGATSILFGCCVADLRAHNRQGRLVLARQTAMYLIRQETDFTLFKTGQELGGRTPATVSFGYQALASRLRISPKLRQKISDIKKLVYPE